MMTRGRPGDVDRRERSAGVMTVGSITGRRTLGGADGALGQGGAEIGRVTRERMSDRGEVRREDIVQMAAIEPHRWAADVRREVPREHGAADVGVQRSIGVEDEVELHAALEVDRVARVRVRHRREHPPGLAHELVAAGVHRKDHRRADRRDVPDDLEGAQDAASQTIWLAALGVFTGPAAAAEPKARPRSRWRARPRCGRLGRWGSHARSDPPVVRHGVGSLGRTRCPCLGRSLGDRLSRRRLDRRLTRP